MSDARSSQAAVAIIVRSNSRFNTRNGLLGGSHMTIRRLIGTWPGAAPSNGPEKRYIRAALKAKPEGAIVAVMVN
jgi:hypothetical protein